MNRRLLVVLAIFCTTLAASCTAQDKVDLPFRSTSGKVIDIGKDSDMLTQRALSPDGMTWAVLLPVTDAKDAPDQLWVCSRRTRLCKVILKPAEAEDPERRLIEISSPTFSLKGTFVYVMTDAWVTSGAIHQVNIRTGEEKFVSAANSMRLILNGKYAGDLLVNQHRYHPGPAYGSYDPTSVIDPDGKVLLQVGSDEADPAVDKWIADNKIEFRQ